MLTASSGVCSHRRAWQPMYNQSSHDSDPAPIRHVSLRHDHYTALAEDVDPTEALMEDDTLPTWRPRYDVCLDDLRYHVDVYRENPEDRPLRRLALDDFKGDVRGDRETLPMFWALHYLQLHALMPMRLDAKELRCWHF